MSKNTPQQVYSSTGGFTNLRDSVEHANTSVHHMMDSALNYLRTMSEEEDKKFYSSGLYPNCETAVFTHPPQWVIQAETDQGWIVHDVFDSRPVDNTARHEMMRWCDQHLQDKYACFLSRMHLYFGFYNRSDASLFRLAYPGRVLPNDEIIIVIQRMHS